MRQILAAVLAGFQSLGSDESRERPVDRLGALAYAALESELASLGVDLIAFKYGHRAASKAPAEAKLALLLAMPRNRLGLSAKQCSRVARHAVTEYLIDFCPVCRGAKEVPDRSGLEGTQPMKPCDGCGGTGVRRWSDSERSEALGGGDFGRALGLAHGYISKGAALAVSGAVRMLERWE